MHEVADPEKEQASRTARLIEAGAPLVGATAGTAVELLGGAPAAFGGAATGVAITQALTRLGADVEQRWLAPRQRVRIGGALAVAVREIDTRLEAGAVPRQDGFFQADEQRADAETLLEGVLLAAADAYEERKVPFLGRLYAGICFDQQVSPAHANLLIRLAQALTFRQLALMAVIWDGDAAGMIEAASRETPPARPLFSDEVAIEIDELERQGLLGTGEPGGTPRRTTRTYVDASSQSPATLALTGPGKRLYKLMDLRQISSPARSEILDGLLWVRVPGRV